MKMTRKTILAVLFAAILAMSSIPAIAGEKTVTLDVKGMTCVACPFIVKRSLTSVDGVTDVTVSYKNKKAVVTFDDAKTTTTTLTEATATSGFPSTVSINAGG